MQCLIMTVLQRFRGEYKVWEKNGFKDDFNRKQLTKLRSLPDTRKIVIPANAGTQKLDLND